MNQRVTDVMTALQVTPAYRWYSSKNRSDKRILQTIFWLAVALLAYAEIWQPLNQFTDSQQERAAESQRVADWIALNRSALEKVSRQPGASNASQRSAGQSGISQVTNSAATFGVTVSRLQPEADGGVSIAVEQQPFNALVQWLANIEDQQGFVIERASIDRGSEDGLVNGQFRFR